jgi:hypothetical protein
MTARTRAAAAVAVVLLVPACSTTTSSTVPVGPSSAESTSTPTAAAPTTSPSTSAISSSPGDSPIVVRLERRTIASPAGYTKVGGVTHLVPARFTTLTTFSAPPSTRGLPHAYILAVALTVSVPLEHALSVRGWCDAVPTRLGHPHAYASGQVLLSSQNPVPGRTVEEKRTRLVLGRALVEVPPDGGHCTLEIAPRTEGVEGSHLEVVRGAVSLTPVDVVTIGIQTSRLIVGVRGSVRPVPVAVSPLHASGASRLTAHGEIEVTDCYGDSQYGSCPVTSFGSSTVSARLAIERVDAAGAVCRVSYGPARLILVTPYEHHAKLTLAPYVEPAGAACGPRARTWIEVRLVTGNEMEVEASASAGQPLTLAWLDR